MSCKGGPSFKPEFDGAAEVALLPGTDLRYVVNSQTPIIRVDGADYYGLEAGVWFAAKSLDGPWEVATSVPSLIYTIPTSSPLHYVTYVRIDGSTPEVVYDGYTPGYLVAWNRPMGSWSMAPATTTSPGSEMAGSIPHGLAGIDTPVPTARFTEIPETVGSNTTEAVGGRRAGIPPGQIGSNRPVPR